MWKPRPAAPTLLNHQGDCRLKVVDYDDSNGDDDNRNDNDNGKHDDDDKNEYATFNNKDVNSFDNTAQTRGEVVELGGLSDGEPALKVALIMIFFIVIIIIDIITVIVIVIIVRWATHL